MLLKNEKLLPLAKDLKKIAVIGSHANLGVLSGGGSSQVYPVGGMAVKDLGPKFFPGPMVYYPSSPMKAIQARYPNATVLFDAGVDAKAAAKLPAILPQPPNLFYDASWIFTRSPACAARVLLTMTCVSASSAPLTAAVVSPVSTTVTGSDTTIFC